MGRFGCGGGRGCGRMSADDDGREDGGEACEGEFDGVQVLRAPGEGGAPLVVDAVHVLVEQQAVAPGALVVVPVVGEVQQVHQPQAEEEVQHQLRHGRRTSARNCSAGGREAVPGEWEHGVRIMVGVLRV